MIATLPLAHLISALLTAAGAGLVVRHAVIRAHTVGRSAIRLGDRLTPGLLIGLLLIAAAAVSRYLVPEGAQVPATGWFLVVVIGIFVCLVSLDPMPWVVRLLSPVLDAWTFVTALVAAVVKRLRR